MAVTPWRARDRLRRRVVPKVGNRRTDWPVYKAILFNLNDKKVKFPSSERSVEWPPDFQRFNESATISKSNNNSNNNGSNTSSSNGRVKITSKSEVIVASGAKNTSISASDNRGYRSHNVNVREYRVVIKRGLRKFSDMSEANALLETIISNFEACFGGQVISGNNTNKPTTTKKFKTSGEKSRISSPLCEHRQQTNCWEQVVKDKTKLIEMHAF